MENWKSSIRLLRILRASFPFLFQFLELSPCRSQNNVITFSKLYFETYSTQLRNIGCFENGYVLNGSVVDADSVAFFPAINYAIDLFGNEVEKHKFGNSQVTFNCRSNSNVKLYEDEFMVTSSSIKNNLPCVTLLWINSLGDTLKTISFNSPTYSPNVNSSDFITSNSLGKDINGNLYISCNVIQSETFGDFAIFKFDSIGNEIWNYIHSGEASYEFCKSIKIVKDGIVGAGCAQDTSVPTDFIMEHFFKLDFDGNVVWEFDDIPEYNFGTPNDMIAEDDGFVVVTGIRDFVDGGNSAIYKVDSLGNLLWVNDLDFYYHSYLSCIDRTCDGGYIASGVNVYDVLPADTIDGDHNDDIILLKFDHEGQEQWMRRFRIVQSVEDRHVMYDLQTTSDGGMIMVGEATNEAQNVPESELPIQKGWVLKLDACGCLVPGCDSFCLDNGCLPTQEIEPQDMFAIGPNPAKETLNIYIGKSAPQYGSFQLFNAVGKLVKGFDYSKNDISYIWSISDLSAGGYTIVLKDKNGFIEHKKLVIE